MIGLKLALLSFRKIYCKKVFTITIGLKIALLSYRKVYFRVKFIVSSAWKSPNNQYLRNFPTLYNIGSPLVRSSDSRRTRNLIVNQVESQDTCRCSISVDNHLKWHTIGLNRSTGLILTSSNHNGFVSQMSTSIILIHRPWDSKVCFWGRSRGSQS